MPSSSSLCASIGVPSAHAPCENRCETLHNEHVSVKTLMGKDQFTFNAFSSSIVTKLYPYRLIHCSFKLITIKKSFIVLVDRKLDADRASTWIPFQQLVDEVSPKVQENKAQRWWQSWMLREITVQIPNCWFQKISMVTNGDNKIARP